FEVYLSETRIDLETGLESEGSQEVMTSNIETLRRTEEKVISEVEDAAQEAVASLRERMPGPESAAEGVYAHEKGTPPRKGVTLEMTSSD
ncbi:MAG TPA: hypothetical protein VJQ56_02590, partial [Blastocatellia bacterium]|nr:hypothetical protein [Blastocatellia bacterium]